MTGTLELQKLRQRFLYYHYNDDYKTFLNILLKRKLNPNILLYIGLCYLFLDKYDLGKQYINEAVKNSNYNGDIIKAAIYYFFNKYLYNDVEEYSKLLLDNTKYIGEGYCYLTRLYIETERIKEADSIWEKFNNLIDNSSQEMQALYIDNKIEFFKISKFVNNNAKEIIKCYESLEDAIKMNLSCNSYEYIIDSYIELGEEQQAIDICNIILEMDVKNDWYKSYALKMKGDCYYSLEKINDAIKCYKKLNTNHYDSKMLYLAKSYEKLGNSELAIQSAKEYIKIARKKIKNRNRRKYELQVFEGLIESDIDDAKKLIIRNEL